MAKPEKSYAPQVAVVVVSYNSADYLDRCLSSLNTSSYPAQKVIVVDNNSSDSSVKVAKKYDCRIINLKENLGFAGGNNRALELEEVDSADYVFLLNPDARVEKDTVGKLVKASGGKKIIQPLILLENEHDLVNTAGNVLNFLGFSYCGGYRKNKANYLKPCSIPIASGAAVIIPNQIIKTIGLFDNIFFLYHEDADFSWRARITGYEIGLQPSAKVYHQYSFSRNKAKYFYAERNRLFFIAKNYQTKTLVVLLPIIFVNEIAMTIFALLGGWLTFKLKSSWEVIINFRYIMEQRRRIKQLRKKTDRDLTEFMTTNLDFAEVKFGALHYYQKMLRWYWLLARKLV